MREDMGKVLVERPRVKSGVVPGRTGRRYAKWVQKGIASGDGSAACEGIKRRYLGGAARLKHFNEHLGPLRKFVESNVGRPWDKVYAEICRHVDRGNVVQKHVLTHLFQYVVVDVELIDGEPYRKARDRSAYRNRPLRGPNQWYVCPKSGLLKRAKVVSKRERKRRKTVLEKPVAWVTASQFVRRGAGGWELVTVNPWPVQFGWGFRNPPPPRVFDVIFRMIVTPYDTGPLADYYGKRVYAVAVRTLRESELDDLPVTLPGKLAAPNVVR
jgi:hypothetical protein